MPVETPPGARLSGTKRALGKVLMLVRIRDQGICAHPAASKPALLCNPPAHRTNPLHQAEFRPNTTTPAFITAYLINWIIFPFTTDSCVSLSRWESSSDTSQKSQSARYLYANSPPRLHQFSSAALQRSRSDRLRERRSADREGNLGFYFSFLFEHFCEKPVMLSHLFHVTEPKLSADFIFVQYSFYNFLRK